MLKTKFDLNLTRKMQKEIVKNKKIKSKLENSNKKKIFQFKKKQKLFNDDYGIIETSKSNGFAFKINRRFANKRFFYQYKLSQKRLLKKFYAEKDGTTRKLMFFNNKQEIKQKGKEKEPDFWLFIKPTVNNLFVYIYNIDILRQKSISKRRKTVKKKKKLKKTRKLKKIKRTYKVKFMCISLGVSGYKGPTKTSYVAAEETGVLFSKKLHKKKLNVFNLVLLCRLNRRIRMFMKGLQRVNKLRFKYIYSMPRRAHNGSRVKKRRRK